MIERFIQNADCPFVEGWDEMPTLPTHPPAVAVWAAQDHARSHHSVGAHLSRAGTQLDDLWMTYGKCQVFEGGDEHENSISHPLVRIFWKI